ncbi:hypothetical protein SLS62_009756 [Diatrype stigma]|uniref:Uncharacterized protein n=1 Tax=Diatrype stigma TaxID=117547 RepID=A0AAN9YJV8_9PEZI
MSSSSKTPTEDLTIGIEIEGHAAFLVYDPDRPNSIKDPDPDAQPMRLKLPINIRKGVNFEKEAKKVMQDIAGLLRAERTGSVIDGVYQFYRDGWTISPDGSGSWYTQPGKRPHPVMKPQYAAIAFEIISSVYKRLSDLERSLTKFLGTSWPDGVVPANSEFVHQTRNPPLGTIESRHMQGCFYVEDIMNWNRVFYELVHISVFSTDKGFKEFVKDSWDDYEKIGKGDDYNVNNAKIQSLLRRIGLGHLRFKSQMQLDKETDTPTQNDLDDVFVKPQ